MIKKNRYLFFASRQTWKRRRHAPLFIKLSASEKLFLYYISERKALQVFGSTFGEVYHEI